MRLEKDYTADKSGNVYDTVHNGNEDFAGSPIRIYSKVMLFLPSKHWKGVSTIIGQIPVEFMVDSIGAQTFQSPDN